LLPQMRAVAAAVRADVSIPPADPTWIRLLPWLGALAFRAASPVIPDEQRAALREMLTALGELHRSGAPARGVELTPPAEKRDPNGSAVVRTAGSTIVVAGTGQHYFGPPETHLRLGVEVGPTFGLPSTWVLRAANPIELWDPQRLSAVEDLLA